MLTHASVQNLIRNIVKNRFLFFAVVCVFLVSAAWVFFKLVYYFLWLVVYITLFPFNVLFGLLLYEIVPHPHAIDIVCDDEGFATSTGKAQNPWFDLTPLLVSQQRSVINDLGAVFADTRCALHRYHERYFQDAYFHDPSTRLVEMSVPGSILVDGGSPELSQGLHVSYPDALLPPDDVLARALLAETSASDYDSAHLPDIDGPVTLLDVIAVGAVVFTVSRFTIAMILQPALRRRLRVRLLLHPEGVVLAVVTIVLAVVLLRMRHSALAVILTFFASKLHDVI
eukprot:m.159045 g.159045  ORF g.159045 m.159045 type:complete len:284 (+) comp17990_c0_seq1:322-1173(+)